MSITKTKPWHALSAHYADIKDQHMRDMFDSDPERAKRFSLEAAGLFLDYSKNRITDKTLALLTDLAKAANVTEKRDQLFSGHIVNQSEQRAALHTALRRPETDEIVLNGQNIMPDIHSALRHMKQFSDKVRSGVYTGVTGQPIDTIISIGIGGSDLGSRLVIHALSQPDTKINCHFVSNIDGADINFALAHSNPETTLVIIASKSFETLETMTNAHTAKSWLKKHLQNAEAINRHCIAISANPENAKNFGIDPDRIFEFAHWVGGRYSIWSAIGLPICITLGFDTFKDFLRGAYDMDRHFLSTPADKNMPILLAMIGIWYRNFFAYPAYTILPYAQGLGFLPRYLQQLDMESNGKRVHQDGQSLNYNTGPILFGQRGTDGQHAFYQALHQGTDIVPADFILVQNPSHHNPDINHDHHTWLLANGLAQSSALMLGQDNISRPEQHFPGNRPSNTITMKTLDAYRIGALIALYEHKVFVQSAIWDINPFDQWGVELGKAIARDIHDAMIQADRQIDKTSGDYDASTKNLMKQLSNT